MNFTKNCELELYDKNGKKLDTLWYMLARSSDNSYYLIHEDDMAALNNLLEKYRLVNKSFDEEINELKKSFVLIDGNWYATVSFNKLPLYFTKNTKNKVVFYHIINHGSAKTI